MEYQKINSYIIGIYKDLDILYRIDNIKNFKNIIEFRNFFDNSDQEWSYIYYLKNSDNLIKIRSYLRELVEKEHSLFNRSDFDNYLSQLESSSDSLFGELKEIVDHKPRFTDEDIQYSTILNNQLKELSKFRYLKKEYISLNANFNDLKVSSNELKEELSSLNLKNTEIKKIHEESIDALEQIKNKNKLLSSLIDATANDEIKILYDQIYDDEIIIANKYRKWALWIFAAVGSFLLIGFLIVSIQNWNHLRNPSFIEIKLGWDSLFKTLMLFSLTTPAWYLTKESSKHRQVAYKAKMLGTELAAFPLYAREFKDEERLELRKSLADRFFGQELYGSSTPKADNSSSTEQMKLLAEMNKVTVEAIKVQQTLLGKKE